MPEVSFRHDRRQVLLPAAVFHPDPANLRFKRVTALIDTGATMSGIRRDIADELQLPRQGKIVITTPSGDFPTRLHRLRIGLYPAAQASAHPFVFPDSFLAIQCSPGEIFDMLIGMDLIGRCDLLLLADGSGTLRLPDA